MDYHIDFQSAVSLSIHKQHLLISDELLAKYAIRRSSSFLPKIGCHGLHRFGMKGSVVAGLTSYVRDGSIRSNRFVGSVSPWDTMTVACAEAGKTIWSNSAAVAGKCNELKLMASWFIAHNSQCSNTSQDKSNKATRKQTGKQTCRGDETRNHESEQI